MDDANKIGFLKSTYVYGCHWEFLIKKRETITWDIFDSAHFGKMFKRMRKTRVVWNFFAGVKLRIFMVNLMFVCVDNSRDYFLKVVWRTLTRDSLKYWK